MIEPIHGQCADYYCKICTEEIRKLQTLTTLYEIDIGIGRYGAFDDDNIIKFFMKTFDPGIAFPTLQSFDTIDELHDAIHTMLTGHNCG
jgi:hypothetical protein